MIQKIQKEYPEEEGVGRWNVKKIVRRVKGGDKMREEKKRKGKRRERKGRSDIFEF